MGSFPEKYHDPIIAMRRAKELFSRSGKKSRHIKESYRKFFLLSKLIQCVLHFIL